MCPNAVEERCEFEAKEAVDRIPDSLSQQLMRSLAARTVKKADEFWIDTCRWWTEELHAGGPPIDLRIRAAAAYYAAAEKLRELSPKPKVD